MMLNTLIADCTGSAAYASNTKSDLSGLLLLTRLAFRCHAHDEIARAVLTGITAGGQPPADAVEDLADELAYRIRAELARQYRERTGPRASNPAAVVVALMGAPDLGPAAAKVAADTVVELGERGTSTTLIHQDRTGASAVPLLVRLAWCLWEGLVQPRREAERAKPAALSGAVLSGLGAVHRRGGRIEGDRVLSAHGVEVAEFGRVRPLNIPVADTVIAEQIARQSVGLLGSLNAWRCLTWEAIEGRNRVLSGARDVRALRVEGGWGALARDVGAGGSQGAWEEVRAIVMTQAHMLFRWPDGSYGNLLSYEYRPARGRFQTARTSLILGDALLPDFIDSLRGEQNRSAREARRLVPITTPPPLVGRERDHGAQVALWWRLLLELRQGAREIPGRGGVVVPNARIRELAGEVGLPTPTLHRALDRWVSDGNDGPAVLRRDGNLLALAESLSDAWEFITEAGQREVAGKARAKRRKRKVPK
jgi:hypothetical protein